LPRKDVLPSDHAATLELADNSRGGEDEFVCPVVFSSHAGALSARLSCGDVPSKLRKIFEKCEAEMKPQAIATSTTGIEVCFRRDLALSIRSRM
jgi:hypothetical protein